MRFSDHPRLLTVLLACCAIVLAGCGAEDGQPSGSEPGSGPSSLSPSPTETDTATPGATTPPPTPASTLPATATLTDRLLATDQVPGLNAQWHWQDGATGAAEETPFGLCAKADLASIGATAVVQRTYFPPVDTDDNAAEQIADFPDAKTASTAVAVLKSWQKTCASRIPGADPSVRAITPVTVSSGTGAWYLASYTLGADEGRFHAFGFAVSGTRIAVLSIDNGGQDYNYPVGGEPMVAMVRSAAARLG